MFISQSLIVVSREVVAMICFSVMAGKKMQDSTASPWSLYSWTSFLPRKSHNYMYNQNIFLKSTWHNRFILIHVDILSSYSQRWWKSLFFRTNRGILRQLGYPATWKSKDISSIFYLILKSYIISYHMYLDLIYINRYNVI